MRGNGAPLSRLAYPVTLRSRVSKRKYATPATEPEPGANNILPPSSRPAAFSPSPSGRRNAARRPDTPPENWDENPNLSISAFSELPSTDFGVNQHMIINDEFKEALRQILWQFRAPIRYAFAYGSGVFPQSGPTEARGSTSTSVHPRPSDAVSTVQGHPGKMIDFIFGVTHTQHWHALNLQQHRDHYSLLGSLGSAAVSRVQDAYGAGVYFHPYVRVNGTLIKYGIVNLDTLCTDLSAWSTLYLAGRLHKPVKILRDDPRVRLANQINLLSAVRAALLLLPEAFAERDLYATIAGLSYTGDPRVRFAAEDPGKVAALVAHQLPHFRQLYAPLVRALPNVAFVDPACARRGWAQDPGVNARLRQDMDPRPRGNMVRRLPRAFRERLYFAFQARYQIPTRDFNKMLEASQDEDQGGIYRREGGPFERRVAAESPEMLGGELRSVITKTVKWPSEVQSVKSLFTAGVGRSWRYMQEKLEKNRQGKVKAQEKVAKQAQEASSAKIDQRSTQSEGSKEKGL